MRLSYIVSIKHIMAMHSLSQKRFILFRISGQVRSIKQFLKYFTFSSSAGICSRGICTAYSLNELFYFRSHFLVKIQNQIGRCLIHYTCLRHKSNGSSIKKVICRNMHKKAHFASSIHNYKLFIFPVIEVEEFFIVLHQNMNVSKRKDKKNTE